MKYDGIAMTNVELRIFLNQLDEAFSSFSNMKTRNREESTIVIARITKKQALALGTLLIQNSR